MSLKDPNPVNPSAKKRVAIVIANSAVSSTTGWPVGFWWSELTHPYHVFTEVGYEVEVFSPAGGKLIPAAATGLWAGKTNQIAVRIADAWEYHAPKIGWLCYIEDEAKLSAYKSTGWSAGIAI